MNKSPLTELAVAAPAAPQSKRSDAAFKQAAVENWLKSRKPGTQIAAELGISYPSLKEWKRSYNGSAMPEHGDLAAENRTLRAELARVREVFFTASPGYFTGQFFAAILSVSRLLSSVL